MTWLAYLQQDMLIIKRSNLIKDKSLINFDKSLNTVLKNLAKSVAADGEGASKFINIR